MLTLMMAGDVCGNRKTRDSETVASCNTTGSVVRQCLFGVESSMMGLQTCTSLLTVH